MHDERPLKIIGSVASVRTVYTGRWNVSDIGIRSNLGRVEDRFGWLAGSTTMPDDRRSCLIASRFRSSEIATISSSLLELGHILCRITSPGNVGGDFKAKPNNPSPSPFEEAKQHCKKAVDDGSCGGDVDSSCDWDKSPNGVQAFRHSSRGVNRLVLDERRAQRG
jgi:hypothetical protein